MASLEGFRFIIRTRGPAQRTHRAPHATARLTAAVLRILGIRHSATRDPPRSGPGLDADATDERARSSELFLVLLECVPYTGSIHYWRVV